MKTFKTVPSFTLPRVTSVTSGEAFVRGGHFIMEIFTTTYYMTLKELSDLDMAQQRLRFPSHPETLIIRTKFSDKTANGLAKCIEFFISYKGGIARRINTMGRYLPGKSISKGFYGNVNTKGKYIPTTSVLGAADFSILINGINWECEIKIGKDRQSSVQKEYQKRIESSGGHYSIVKNFQDFITQYNELISTL